MTPVSLTVNGKAVRAETEPRTLLVQLLRDRLGLTGTHIGCDTSQCGACVVHLNGKAVKSCTVLALSCEGAKVTTIEGVGSPARLHPMQKAFQDHHALQCGFCTPGMILTTKQLLADHPNPTDHEIRHGLEGNLCRCTGYQHIVNAVRSAAGKAGA